VNIDWGSIVIAVASALVTALAHRLAHPTNPSKPASSTGHPILDSVVSMLQGVVLQNPQLLTSLNGVLVQLQHPAGSVNVNFSTGGTSNASQLPANPVIPVSLPVAAGR